MAYPPENYPLTPAGVEDYPVKVGSMLLTLVDPHKGFESAYNRWYERDHFYAGCMEGPWQIAGSRWVATREMKGLRWGTEAVASPIDAGSYVAIYWVEAGHHKDWDDWALPQVQKLYADGRGFLERSHVHTATFDHVGAVYRDADPVPVELALDAAYDGIIGVWLDGRDGLEADGLHERIATGSVIRPLLDGSDIEIGASWSVRPEFRESRDSAPMSLGSPGGKENRLCQLFFVRGDVRDALPRFKTYTEALAAEGLADTALVAPFLRTKVGTDTYVDQIW
jgi:hypothetical protein